MDEQMVKEIVKKMFATGELQIGINIRKLDEDKSQFTVYVSDSNDEILQSASDFIPKA